jgi:hypothetical protein
MRLFNYKNLRGYCILAPPLNANCDFTLIFLTLQFYPHFMKMKLQFTPTPWTTCNGVKDVETRPICPYQYASAFIVHMYLDTVLHSLHHLHVGPTYKGYLQPLPSTSSQLSWQACSRRTTPEGQAVVTWWLTATGPTTIAPHEAATSAQRQRTGECRPYPNELSAHDRSQWWWPSGSSRTPAAPPMGKPSSGRPLKSSVSPVA